MQSFHRVPLFWLMCVPFLATCLGSSPPSILSFWPSRGPWEGGTNVTITVTGLEFKLEDIIQNIKVAKVPCTPLEVVDMHVPMKKIVCTIEESGLTPEREGPVEIQINANRTVSKENFKFVDPKLKEILPSEGSTNGGDQFAIRGENLDAGTSVEAFIGDSPCSIYSRSSALILCITGPSISKKDAKVYVKFDENIRNLNDDSFTYRENRLPSNGNDFDPIYELYFPSAKSYNLTATQ